MLFLVLLRVIMFLQLLTVNVVLAVAVAAAVDVMFCNFLGNIVNPSKNRC